MPLFRYYGIRRYSALLFALPLAWLVRAATANEAPAGFYDWPYAAQRAAAHLVAGSYAAAYAAWVGVCLAGLRQVLPLAWRRSSQIAAATLTGIGLAPAVWLAIKAIAALAACPPSFALAALRSLVDAVGVPLLIGVAPLAAVEIDAWLRSRDWLMSLLLAGRGSFGSWAKAYAVRRFVRPTPEEISR